MAQDRISIVGGGVCGALVAIHLLRSGRPLAISLFEQAGEVGRGIAYSAPGAEILLNVPAARMSPLPEEPALFLDWASGHVSHPLLNHRAVTPQSFLPRALFGDFIAELLASAIRESEYGSFQLIRAKVHTITRDCSRWVAHGAFGTEESEHLVLALGNPPPTLPAALAALPSARLINPWSGLTFNTTSLRDSVICVGSGLTAVDVAIKLLSSGYSGTIHFVSRHGLLPQCHHSDPLQVPHTKLEVQGGSLRGLIRSVRTQMKAALQQGEPWQIVLDTLRPKHQTLWRALSTKEQERFIRHLGAYWEVHRHRLAPELHHTIVTRIAENKIRLHSGNVLQASVKGAGLELTLRERGGNSLQTLSGSHLFLCTGPARSLSAWQNPLIDGLLQHSFIERDPLGIGFYPSSLGEQSNLYVLGAALRGALWESTAMRELAIQAQSIAKKILSP